MESSDRENNALCHGMDCANVLARSTKLIAIERRNADATNLFAAIAAPRSGWPIHVAGRWELEETLAAGMHWTTSLLDKLPAQL